MRKAPYLFRLCLVFLMLLGVLTACGSDGGETPAVVLPPATSTPEPLQGLFPTPTADLFQFLLITPTSTLALSAPTSAPTLGAVVLPKTGADRSEAAGRNCRTGVLRRCRRIAGATAR
jgi:hypothetical protein